jgi:hypothetical protein
LAILSGCVFEATAASKEIQFDSWTTENGLPQNSVNDILNLEQKADQPLGDFRERC